MSHSRISYDDGDGEFDQLNWGRWEHNAKLALASARGKRALREVETALLALPEGRLVKGTFWDVGDWGVSVDACVLGAYGHYKGMTEQQLLAVEEEGSADGQAFAMASKELTFTLAWILIEKNDEAFGSLTPEQRYEAMLRWVRERMA